MGFYFFFDVFSAKICAVWSWNHLTNDLLYLFERAVFDCQYNLLRETKRVRLVVLDAVEDLKRNLRIVSSKATDCGIAIYSGPISPWMRPSPTLRRNFEIWEPRYLHRDPPAVQRGAFSQSGTENGTADTVEKFRRMRSPFSLLNRLVRRQGLFSNFQPARGTFLQRTGPSASSREGSGPQTHCSVDGTSRSRPIWWVRHVAVHGWCRSL